MKPGLSNKRGSVGVLSAIGLIMAVAVSLLVIVVVFSVFLDKLPAQGGVADTVIASAETGFYGAVSLAVLGMLVLSSVGILLVVKSLGQQQERY